MSLPVLSPKILTANHLISGEVIYLSRDGGWVSSIHQALLITDPLVANERLAEAETQTSIVVGPYLIEAAQSLDNCIQPKHFREGFRMRGPSNLFHGKQAEPAI